MGGGGPAKAAEPKVTPYVEPAAPQNPIPNWFANRTANNFTPDFSQAQTAFSLPQQQTAPQAPMQAPMQTMPFQDVPDMMRGQQQPFMGPQARHQAMDMGVPPPMGRGFNPRPTNEPMQHQMFRPQDGTPNSMMQPGVQEENVRRPFAIPTPRYANYTDTDPRFSTGADGNNTLWTPWRR